MIVNTENAPKAIGPYSQATIFENMIFTSGQLPLDPETGKIVEGGIEAQTKQSLTNLAAVLAAGDSSLNKVLKTTVYLKDIKDFAAMNIVYSQFFNGEYPGRSAIQIAKLPMDALVEIEAIAHR
jgi:2-iminobutanoate/2-iminopropanoate deaminase